ncbi:elongation factor G [Desulfurivibrio dismutans]|uniref:elongation factor G n=1 Tax=Desulfurivibrio dismutans TaxID=1398908 RepID=UPI0023D9BB2B|nr:elongation factor G [Desulfurivibrio alkaliphilus]MDF1613919.1 elongation factor G [Desulfurivibrio alkaliphilus]
MKLYDDKYIKNIVLLGSVKSGKTTLAETMVFEAGLSQRRGTVEDKNTISDFHEIEHQRGNSVYATLLHTDWRDYKINIIDTPGLDDFVGETFSALRVADTAVMLINAQYGVEVGTELTWNYTESHRIPAMFAVNQVDHPKSDFFSAVEAIQESFGPAAILMQYPLNEGDGFDCIIDLLKMTMYKFPPEGGKPEKLAIPEAEKERAAEWHNQLVEKAAENDEELMELYFEKGSLDEDEMRQGLKIGMLNREVFPIFCLSAKRNMGSGRMMGFIDNVAPSATEMAPEKTADDRELPCDPAGPPVVFVFKTLMEQFLGKITFFKVCSGEISEGMDLVNGDTGETERLNQLFIMSGKNRQPVSKLVAGDLGATLKMKGTKTNHTLHGKDFPISLKPIDFPEPRIRTAVAAADKKDDDKLGEALREIQAEDPTIKAELSPELRQLILWGQGELHLNLVKWRLENIYGIKVEFIEPKIPYRETIRKAATATYRHKKQSGGSGQFAEVHLRIEPHEEGMDDPTDLTVRGKDEIDLPWGGKLVFYNCIVGGVIDAKFLPSILKGVMEKMQEGPMTGSYVRDVRVMVFDGKMHQVDSNDISFKIAGAQAFKEAFRNANPLVLEPLYDMEVMVPEDLMGDVMSDLQSRRSMISGMESQGRYQLIKAITPLAEQHRYSTTLKSLTQGRASFRCSFREYAPVPQEIQQKLTATE